MDEVGAENFHPKPGERARKAAQERVDSVVDQVVSPAWAPAPGQALAMGSYPPIGRGLRQMNHKSFHLSLLHTTNPAGVVRRSRRRQRFFATRETVEAY